MTKSMKLTAWLLLVAALVMLAIIFGCRWRAAGVDLSRQSDTTVAPVTTQLTDNDFDPTLIAYGDLKNWMQNTIRNTQNDPWPAVATNGIQTVCILLAVRWWIRRHSYAAQKPQYEAQKRERVAAIREAERTAEELHRL